MNKQRLLQAVENLSYSERVRRMIGWGREAQTDTNIAAVLAELRTGDFYERWLALLANYRTRDGAQALAALKDPSRLIRSAALNQAADLCHEPQLNALLTTVSIRQRSAILLLLRKAKHFSVIDIELERLAAQNSPELPKFLAYGSGEVAARLLPAVFEMLSDANWRRLAKFHPGFVADTLLQRAQAAATADTRLIWQIKNALPSLAKKAPDKALALVTELARVTPLTSFDLSLLARRRPNELAALALQTNSVNFGVFHAVAHKLADVPLHAVLRKTTLDLYQVPRVLKRLPFARREAAFDAIYAPDAVVPAAYLSYLPAKRREQEARRHLTLPQFAATPHQRLPYAAYLPWDELQTLLDPYLKNPDAELRGTAVYVLAHAAWFQREHLGAVLEFYASKKLEQDPVRLHILRGLADVPVPAFQATHLELLTAILKAMLDAKDRSYATTDFGGRLVLRLMPVYPQWAAQRLGEIVKTAGQMTSSPLADQLSAKDVAAISPFLLPVFSSWVTRERETTLLQALSIFGRRLRDWKEGIELLETLLERTNQKYLASNALTMIQRYAPQRFAALVPELIRQDVSWGVMQTVSQFLHRKRQDLLAPYLGRQAFRGKFSTGRNRVLLAFGAGFQRWTATQQHTFAQTLTDVLADTDQNNSALFGAFAQLENLPVLAPKTLSILTKMAEQKTNIFHQSMALQALGSLDGDQGIPTLIEALNDDQRAFYAIYGLRKWVLNTEPERVFSVLALAPRNKVTVAKEILRLIGELQTEAAFQFLRIESARELQRDVRVALLRALWEYRDRPETWAILEQAAVSEDAPLAQMAGRTPEYGLSPANQVRLLGMLEAGLSHPSPEVRFDLLTRLATLPVNDSERVLLPRLQGFTHSALPQERSLASQAIVGVYGMTDFALLSTLIAEQIPNRRILQTLYEALLSQVSKNKAYAAPMVRAILPVLAADPVTAEMRISLTIQALTPDEVVSFILTMAQTRELHADVLMTLTQSLIPRYAGWFGEAERDRMERTFAASEDRYVRRVGFAMLLELAKTSRGWDTELRTRLYAYRADSAALVASAAQFTFLPDEV